MTLPYKTAQQIREERDALIIGELASAVLNAFHHTLKRGLQLTPSSPVKIGSKAVAAEAERALARVPTPEERSLIENFSVGVLELRRPGLEKRLDTAGILAWHRSRGGRMRV